MGIYGMRRGRRGKKKSWGKGENYRVTELGRKQGDEQPFLEGKIRNGYLEGAHPDDALNLESIEDWRQNRRSRKLIGLHNLIDTTALQRSQETSILLTCGVYRRRLRPNPPSTQASLSANHTEVSGAGDIRGELQG